MDGRKEIVYVKLDEYKDIKDIIKIIKTRLSQAKSLLRRISELKKQEDAEIEKWHSELDGVDERIDGIDRTLAEPEM